jgi:hypothetical protein
VPSLRYKLNFSYYLEQTKSVNISLRVNIKRDVEFRLDTEFI